MIVALAMPPPSHSVCTPRPVAEMGRVSISPVSVDRTAPADRPTDTTPAATLRADMWINQVSISGETARACRRAYIRHQRSTPGRRRQQATICETEGPRPSPRQSECAAVEIFSRLPFARGVGREHLRREGHERAVPERVHALRPQLLGAARQIRAGDHLAGGVQPRHGGDAGVDHRDVHSGTDVAAGPRRLSATDDRTVPASSHEAVRVAAISSDRAGPVAGRASPSHPSRQRASKPSSS